MDISKSRRSVSRFRSPTVMGLKSFVRKTFSRVSRVAKDPAVQAANRVFLYQRGKQIVAPVVRVVSRARTQAERQALERDLAGQLARDARRADVAANLARLVLDQGRPLSSVAGLEYWCLATDPQTRSLEPFVFMPIPNTAGETSR